NGQARGHLETEVVETYRQHRTVLYFGDLDRAGGHIEQHTRAVLERADEPADLWERVAITQEQGDEYGYTPIMKVDKRYNDRTPYEAWETEALGQARLVQILRDKFDDMLPEPLDDVRERERRERRQIERLLRQPRGRRGRGRR